jgi:hypothetical protein
VLSPDLEVAAHEGARGPGLRRLPHPATKPPPPPRPLGSLGRRPLSCPQGRLAPEGQRWACLAREPHRPWTPDDLTSQTTPSAMPVAVAAAVVSATSAGWGRVASWPSLVGGGTDASTTDSVAAMDSSGTVSAASSVVEGAKPPAHSYWCSAYETDAIVSRIDGSAHIRSVATSTTLSGSWGHQHQ